MFPGQLQMRFWRLNWRHSLPVGAIIVLMVALNVYPDPLFSFSHSYRGFTVSSDRPIDPAIDRVLDDAERRLSTSTHYHAGDHFRIFICNRSWRLGLFTFNASLGGGTVYGTRNIFIRESDIAANKVIGPHSVTLLDERDRPLSYFIAHEATHVVELRRYGLVLVLLSPRWLEEGYADLIGKAGNFDVEANRALLLRNDLLLSDRMARNGLYRRYHLMVASEFRNPGVTIDGLFAKPPTEADALQAARTGKVNRQP
jgi:hypothetical protein